MIACSMPHPFLCAGNLVQVLWTLWTLDKICTMASLLTSIVSLISRHIFSFVCLFVSLFMHVFETLFHYVVLTDLEHTEKHLLLPPPLGLRLCGHCPAGFRDYLIFFVLFCVRDRFFCVAPSVLELTL